MIKHELKCFIEVPGYTHFCYYHTRVFATTQAHYYCPSPGNLGDSDGRSGPAPLEASRLPLLCLAEELGLAARFEVSCALTRKQLFVCNWWHNKNGYGPNWALYWNLETIEEICIWNVPRMNVSCLDMVLPAVAMLLNSLDMILPAVAMLLQGNIQL